jgi:phage-related protein
MTYPTFAPPFPPLEPIEETRTLRLINATFGDGYAQRTVDGSEPESSAVQLTFEPLSISQLQSIVSFLRSNAGSPITYALPTDGVSRDWVATMWTPTRNETSYSLQITLAPAP